jgi:hypothetical protein
VVYNEFLCFYLSYLSWPRLPPTDDVTASAVLFIADPQIQGSLHEPPGITYFATIFKRCHPARECLHKPSEGMFDYIVAEAYTTKQ